jgi:hypothetical protein
VDEKLGPEACSSFLEVSLASVPVKDQEWKK